MTVTLEGFCPVCERTIALHLSTKGRAVAHVLVHHGFRRPGHGSIVGDCFGVGMPPHEMSTFTATEYMAFSKRCKLDAERHLDRLKSGQVTELFRSEVVPVPTTGERARWWILAPERSPGSYLDIDPGWQQAMVLYRADEVEAARLDVYRQLLSAAIAETQDRVRGLDRDIARMEQHIATWQLKPVTERPEREPPTRRRRLWGRR